MNDDIECCPYSRVLSRPAKPESLKEIKAFKHPLKEIKSKKKEKQLITMTRVKGDSGVLCMFTCFQGGFG